MVDYSKWDKMGSDDDDEPQRAKPTITRLEGTHKVTIGKDGRVTAEPSSTPSARIVVPSSSSPSPAPAPTSAPTANKRSLDYSKWDDIDPEDSEEEEALENRRLDIAEDDQEMADFKAKIAIEQAPKIEVIEPPTPIAVPKPDTVTTGAITRSELVACFTDSGGSVPSGVDEVRYMWSQTETEVAVAFVVPDSTRAKSVVLTQTAPDASGFDRTAPGARLLITVDGKALLDEEFAYPVEEIEEEHDVDWQLVDFDTKRGQRCIKLTVVKKPIAQGVKLWWKRAFTGAPEIEVRAIQGRKMNDNTSFAARWKEAEDMFKAKVKATEPTYVDVGSDPDDTDESD